MCQVHRAVSAVVRSWWLDGLAAQLLFQQAAEEIAYHQQRNAAARESHTRTTNKRLLARGINPTKTPAVNWDTS